MKNKLTKQIINLTKGHVMKTLNAFLIGLFLVTVWTQTGCAQKNDKENESDDLDVMIAGHFQGSDMGNHFSCRQDDDDDIGQACGGGDRMMLHGMKDLNLTKEQKDKIKSLHIATKKQNIPLMSDLKIKRIEMKELMDAEKPDKDKVAAKIKEMETIRTKLHTNRATTHIDVMNVLTKEQRDKFEEQRCFRGPRNMDRPHKNMKRIRVFEKD